MQCPLYRRRSAAVIFAVLLWAVAPLAHAAPKPKEAPKGPRAIGLVEITKTGKAQLVPVAIFDQGKWFDAQVYRASPVPMAAQWDTVYEATDNGQSVGLFTITSPQQYQNRWVARGNWQPGAGGDGPPAGKKPVLNTARAKSDPEDERPVLHKPGSKPATTAPADAKPAETRPPDNDPDRPVLHKPATSKADAVSTPSRSSAPPDDPDRPTLRRGKPVSTGGDSDLPSPEEMKALSTLTVYPAVSAARNPELRSYKFYFQPGEEDSYRKKMLDLARAEVLTRARTLGLLPPAPPAPAPKPAAKKPAKPAAPAPPVDDVIFDDVNLRSFDLTYSNEPEFVLAVKAHIVHHEPAPKRGAATGKLTPAPMTPPAAPEPGVVISPALTYDVTLVARADLNGDLRRLLLVATDERHLDELPRLELIDAVDADGDGIGDFLFREINGPDAANTGYVIYQSGRDKLWELFRTAR